MPVCSRLALALVLFAASRHSLAACPPPSATILSATLTITGDDQLDIYVNGNFVATTPSNNSWMSLYSYPIPPAWLNPGGPNAIAATVYDHWGGSMGYSYKLQINYSDGSVQEIISDPTLYTTHYFYLGYHTPGPLFMPAPDSLGNPWYSPFYTEGPGWNNAVKYGAKCFAGWLDISSTAGIVPWMGSVACGAVLTYQSWSFRQAFSLCTFATPTLTPTTTPYTPTPTPTATATVPCGYAVRVNAGGPAYVDSSARLWSADQAYTVGGFGYMGASGTYASGAAISGTPDGALYQDLRQGNPLQYRFTVPNGVYQVTLKFAELYWTSPGQRVFSVNGQGGVPIGVNLDLVALAGPNAAYDRSVNLTVSNGLLDIYAWASVDQPVISAIEVLQVASCATPTPSPTSTPSPSPSATPSMALLKTANVSQATIGDTITFCISWKNDSSASVSMGIWDTLSTALSYLGCDNACAVSGRQVSWSLGPKPAGAAGAVCVWAKVTGYP